MEVRLHPAAQVELSALPARERQAIRHAIQKLVVSGTQLRFPHASAVRGAAGVFELRPRAGRSAWRALFGRVGRVVMILAVCPEAQVDPRGCSRAITLAERRAAEVQGE